MKVSFMWLVVIVSVFSFPVFALGPRLCSTQLAERLESKKSALQTDIQTRQKALDNAELAQAFLAQEEKFLLGLYAENSRPGLPVPVLLDAYANKKLSDAKVAAAVAKLLGPNTVAMKISYLSVGGWTVTLYEIRDSAEYIASQVSLNLYLPAKEIADCSYTSDGQQTSFSHRQFELSFQ